MGRIAMVKRRLRIRQSVSLKDRLAAFAKDARKKAFGLPAGSEKDDLLERAERAEKASHIDDWVNSSGLRPPK